jgi:hypothetical protein
LTGYRQQERAYIRTILEFACSKLLDEVKAILLEISGAATKPSNWSFTESTTAAEKTSEEHVLDVAENAMAEAAKTSKLPLKTRCLILLKGRMKAMV